LSASDTQSRQGIGGKGAGGVGLGKGGSGAGTGSGAGSGSGSETSGSDEGVSGGGGAGVGAGASSTGMPPTPGGIPELVLLFRRLRLWRLGDLARRRRFLRQRRFGPVAFRPRLVSPCSRLDEARQRQRLHAEAGQLSLLVFGCHVKPRERRPDVEHALSPSNQGKGSPAGVWARWCGSDPEQYYSHCSSSITPVLFA